MKRSLLALLTALLLCGLVACGNGGGPDPASSAAGSTQSPPASSVRAARTVPDVSGKSFADARSVLADSGFMVQAFGEDGKEWSSIPGPKVTAVSTTPVAGTSTDATEVRVNVNMTQAEQAAAATAALLATRYELRCGSNYSKPPAHSYKDVWTSPEYKSGGTCVLNIDGQSAYSHVSLLPQEQAIVDVIASHGGDVSLPAGAFGAAFTLCARVDAGYADQIVARMDWKKADAYGALALCPDAPHAAVLQEVATAVKVGDGTHVVGQDMEPGTYHSPPSSKDCYWSRTTGGGGIIANDFVGFAPNGVTVSVAAGEGFESQNCGSWTKTG